MPSWLFLLSVSWFILLVSPGTLSASPSTNSARVFTARGVVQELRPDTHVIVIRHEAIAGFMDAMTMPFKVRNPEAVAGLQGGDEITFQLHVTETESWVDRFTKTGTSQLSAAKTNQPARMRSKSELLHCQFTNELGQAVRLADFQGQALAITFFYSRCPLPDYCPRLSRNFQAASQKLAAMTNAPANWHFLSFSFDTEFDSPAMLLAYGKSDQYDPAHWSLLTGPAPQMSQLARECGMTISADGETFNHNFRTLIIDASGHLQMVFPTGGDLSDQIVTEIIKAAGATNSLASNPDP